MIPEDRMYDGSCMVLVPFRRFLTIKYPKIPLWGGHLLQICCKQFSDFSIIEVSFSGEGFEELLHAAKTIPNSGTIFPPSMKSGSSGIGFDEKADHRQFGHHLIPA